MQKNGMIIYAASKTSKPAKEVYFRTDSATDDKLNYLRLVDGRLSRPREGLGSNHGLFNQ
jgi:hypothetical protein